jgi:hypothetical protein
VAIVVSPSGILVGDAAFEEASTSDYADAFVACFFDPDRFSAVSRPLW